MSKRTISRAAADEISNAVYGTIRNLENVGHDRSAIASCLIGIGSGIVGVRDGAETLNRILDNSKAIAEGEGAAKN